MTDDEPVSYSGVASPPFERAPASSTLYHAAKGKVFNAAREAFLGGGESASKDGTKERRQDALACLNLPVETASERGTKNRHMGLFRHPTLQYVPEQEC